MTGRDARAEPPGAMGVPASEPPTAGRLARIPAPLKAAAILAYFAIVAIWLPSAVLRTTVVSERATWVADVIGLTIWAAAMAAGLIGLRRAQRRGLI